MKTIVCIDDEADILKCFKDALEMRGYHVITTTDPDEGIRIIRNHKPVDLLLLDVKMPGKNGFDVYREIRTFHPPTAVIFVTAYPKSFSAEKDEVVKMWQEEFSDGTTDILYKPFPLEALFMKIEAMIGPADDGTPTV